MKIISIINRKLLSLQRWQSLLVLSSFIFLVINLTMITKVNSNLHFGNYFFLAQEIICAFLIHYFFYLLFFVRYIGPLLVYLIFLQEVAVFYFFINFGKNIDPWVIADIIDNFDFVKEFFSVTYLFAILVATIFFIIFSYLISKSKQNNFKNKNFLIFHFVAILTLVFVGIFADKVLKKIRKNYPPLNIVASAIKLNSMSRSDELKDFVKKANESKKIVDANHISYYRNNEKLIVIFIISESVRSDIFFELIPKYSDFIYNNKNIAFYKDVKACATLTRKAVPCLITNVDHSNWQNFINSVNIIDVFNKALFDTHWIDNQPLYGVFDSTYSLLAKNSNNVIEQKSLENNFNSKKLDEFIIPHIKRAIDSNDKNKFIISHLLGSHWHLEERYSEDYRFFHDICESGKDSSLCSRDQVINSYKNSVIYGFSVVEKIIKMVEKENAIVIYTSDHGFSLGENGIYGNAAENNPIEQLNTPLFIWFSDNYKKNNPQNVKNILSKKNKKITHENVFNTIIGCSNIKTSIKNNALDICKNDKNR